MNRQPDIVATVAGRARGRVRLRAVTVTAGAAGLVTAGVIAYNLPAPVQSAHGTGTQPTRVSHGGTGSGSRLSGDGERRTASRPGKSSNPAGGTTAPSHATSGGS
jgi:hypothetical protein